MLVTAVEVEGCGEGVLHAKGCADITADFNRLKKQFGTAAVAKTNWASIEEWADMALCDIAEEEGTTPLDIIDGYIKVKPCAAIKDVKPRLTPEEKAQRKAEREARKAEREARRGEREVKKAERDARRAAREAKAGGKEMVRLNRAIQKDARQVKKYVTMYVGYISEALANGDFAEAMKWANEMAPLTSQFESKLLDYQDSK